MNRSPTLGEILLVLILVGVLLLLFGVNFD